MMSGHGRISPVPYGTRGQSPSRSATVNNHSTSRGAGAAPPPLSSIANSKSSIRMTGGGTLAGGLLVPEDYKESLANIRLAFPQPVSDCVHDSYVIFCIMKALNQVDQMKSKTPLLGPSTMTLDVSDAATEAANLTDDGSSVEKVNQLLVAALEGMPIWGHPNSMTNVVPPTTIPSIVGCLMPAIFNPNMVSEEYSGKIGAVERRVSTMMARLVGYDSTQSTGIFTFGGTAISLYSCKMGIEKAIPGTMENGLCASPDARDAVIVCSHSAHYCKLSLAGWLGLGYKNVIGIDTHETNDINIEKYESTLREIVSSGRKIACIIATMGTTDAHGVDDIKSMVEIRDKLVKEFQMDYVPHVHGDAVIGWAWSVFTEYDVKDNELGFRPRTLHALTGVTRRMKYLHMADTIGIDFHKTGFCPYSSSLLLVKNKQDIATLLRNPEQMPYLFQGVGSHHPGMFTLETSRPGGPVLSAYANLELFGKKGMRVLIGHLAEMAELFREHLESYEFTTVVNDGNFGFVTLFRVYPNGVDTWTQHEAECKNPAKKDELLFHNEYNRKIYLYMQEQSMRGLGVQISMTSCYRKTQYGEPIAALKSYIMSPFIDENSITALMDNIVEARLAVPVNVKVGETKD